MGFKYVDTLATDRDKVRFAIGDVTEDSGPRPGGSNFSDNEIAAQVDSEGTWGKAAAYLCEVLAREWAREAGSVAVGPVRQELTARSQLFQEMAVDLRLQHGGGRTVTQSVPTRVDGFSDDVDAEEIPD